MTHNAEQYEYAIDQGIKLFMRKGFVDVTIDDIISVSGLNRYAIYSAFGTKLDYFKACIQAYCKRTTESLKALADNPEIAPAEAVRQNLYATAAELCETKSGCLVCENIREMRTRAPDLAEFCVKYYKTKEDLFLRILERGKKNGDLAPYLTPSAAASNLLTYKFGLSNDVKRNPNLGSVSRKIDGFVTSLFPNS